MDWQTARDLAEIAALARRLNHDSICFHCQQSAEKYLKALLQELGRVVPRTHDLETLLDLVRPDHPALGPLLRILLILNPYAVEYLYPGMNARKRQARAAVLHAEKVRNAVRERLGLPV
jgi:HEPN domain-containing protein